MANELKEQFRSVKVAIATRRDLKLTYLLPEHLRDKVHVGSQVLVPLRETAQKAFVLELDPPSIGLSFDKLKQVEDLCEEKPLLEKKMMRFARWIANYYCEPMNNVLRAFLPFDVGGRERVWKIEAASISETINAKELAGILTNLQKRAPKQWGILRLLTSSNDKILPLKELGGRSSALKSLLAKKFIKITLRAPEDFLREEIERKDIAPKLNPFQQEAYDKINANLKKTLVGKKKAAAKIFLLFGVTGSGKTEVYLRAMANVLAAGKSILYLCPEIGLSFYAQDRIKARFPEIPLSLLHSRMTSSQRGEQWEKIRQDQSKIVIGARSALFAPLTNLGLIIVDEEHDLAYKQENSPRYQGRDAAVMRAKIENCVIILGSATPSLESYHNALLGRYDLLKLPERVSKRALPKARVVSMSGEKAFKINSWKALSRTFLDELRARIDVGEQAIVLINRRGFAAQIQCQECGVSRQCPNCSLPLRYHKSGLRLLCHFCGHGEPVPLRCPDCGNEQQRLRGFGTQAVVEVLARFVRAEWIARMDADLDDKSRQDILLAFKKKQKRVLVGTQMVSKGFDFPGVTLVGALNADLGLNLPDFRSSERAFQLLCQAIGRAGRGASPGMAILQSFNPHMPAVQFARSQDYERFAKEELQMRKRFGYSPFAKISLLKVRADSEQEGARIIGEFRALFLAYLPPTVFVGNALASPLERADKVYRFQALIRSASNKALTSAFRRAQKEYRLPKGVNIMLDIDAAHFM